MPFRAGIAGHRGYSGAELIRILAHHPDIETVLLDHREAPPEGPQYLRPREQERVPSTADAVRAAGLDVVFLATPPEVSMELAPAMLGAGARVVDLSGAFRLKTVDHYRRWYHEAHAEPDLLAEAAYGLPEFHRDAVVSARLVANPGCYPTAANLAIRPLLQCGAVERSAGIVCDAKSGVSGAGRKASLKTSFCEVAENFSPYAVLDHRHVPEVLMNSGLEESEFSFTAQLIPISRGILETIYFRATKGITPDRLLEIYTNAYAGEPFVRVHAPGSLPDLRHVAYTNFCDIGVHFDQQTGRGVAVSAIDNLGKGAAGQAIQNMNLMLGLPETAGLL